MKNQNKNCVFQWGALASLGGALGVEYSAIFRAFALQHRCARRLASPPDMFSIYRRSPYKYTKNIDLSASSI